MAGTFSIWVLADDRPGNANQVLGVAEAIGFPFAVRHIRYGPLAGLPNALLGGSLAGLTQGARAEFRPPWPDLAIGAGRRTAPVARWLKRQNRDAFLVQMMWPGGCEGIDLVAVPEHDRVSQEAGVIHTLGAPHRITAERLATAAQAFAPHVAHLPRPRIGCLVGGSTRHVDFTPAHAAELGQAACGLASRHGGSLMIATSRRTGAVCETALAEALSRVPHLLHAFSKGGHNPYIEYLASADAVVVTGDSTSMCTEACATGRPVFLYRMPGGTPEKQMRLHERLADLGYVFPLDAPWPERMPPPLYPQREVAEAILDRLPALREATSGPAVASAGLTH
jgi:mitochondrial fission protein ELM1